MYQGSTLRPQNPHVFNLLPQICQTMALPLAQNKAKQQPNNGTLMPAKSNSPDPEDVLNAIGSRSIVLVGLMGAGKTSIGRRLAERLGLPFVDADQEIVAAAGKSIPDIFAEHGEAHFRDGERRVIARLLENGRQVLATGGGAFMNEETRQGIQQHGVSVWLKADVDTLLERVAKRGGRPLLDTDDPAAVLRRLAEIRYPVYATANITVESTNAKHQNTVNDVMQALADWGTSPGQHVANSGQTKQ